MVLEKNGEICWTDRVKNKKLLHRVKDRNMLHIIERGKAKWIGQVLRRKCLLKHVIGEKKEGRVIVTERRGRRSKQLVDDPKETRDTEKRNGQHWIALCGERALEKAMDL